MEEGSRSRNNTDFKYAILICAHNEEAVIRQSLQSIRESDFPSERMKCFVIADNCTDMTVKRALENGAAVIEKEDKKTGNKGRVLNYGIRKIKETYGEEFQVFAVLDSDNTVSPDFLQKLDQMFAEGADIVCGNRLASNAESSWVSACYSLYWSTVTCLYGAGHNAFGLNSMISGTGFAFKAECLNNGQWDTTAISEDMEFYVQATIRGKVIKTVEDAIYYDQQPEKVSIMLNQIRRWQTGAWQVFRSYIKRTLAGLISARDIKSLDLFCALFIFIAPGIFAIIVILLILLWIIYSCNVMYLLYAAAFVTAVYLICVSFGAVSGKISKQLTHKRKGAVFIYPLFLFSIGFISVSALLVPEKKWKQIPHYEHKG